ncbi:anthranilate synthase component I [Butyrivibrio sp. LC3010]|uniref:anthranilate synthase component I n=1 Tax=Butyrivibrio sp. LC3010 TaxID=1280680 RepID=UPI00040A115E|nr:anthranilate synthase component I [Butyrivibrio sp. LC3010]
MGILPEFKDIQKIAANGKYNVIPVSCEILSDFITPIEAMRILKKKSDHVYMLESAQANEYWGRYTFLGFEPKMDITCMDGVIKITDINGDTKEIKGDPSECLRSILTEYKSPKFSYLPTFTGGMVGYFSYDYLGYTEPSVRCNVEDNEGFMDMDLMLFDKVIAFDNTKQKIILIVNMKLESAQSSVEDDKDVDANCKKTIDEADNENLANYKKAIDELKELSDLLHNGEKDSAPAGKLLEPMKPLFEKEQYCQMVEKAKRHIFEGDIFQIVLSNRFSAPFEGSLFETYRALRTINPSPYMFYFSGTEMEVAGASPETLVKLENGVLHTFPLAGTRPRGATEEEDKRLEKELLADEKELAEHNMLVDLGRNDLGKISKFGSVQVEKLHSIERYSHVMHIGSTVRGEIRDDKDALDAISSVLPAGTLSGAPKIRACQIIGELENNKRGIYGGAIGYIDFTGNMDTCIAIRIVYKKNGKVFVRSGAGIVADSVPEKEFEECMNKARAAMKALDGELVTVSARP